MSTVSRPVERLDPEVFEVHDEVATALREGRAVVALESTIISHGLPRPENLRVATSARPGLRSTLTPLTAAVDGCLYGHQPATAEVFDECRALVGSIWRGEGAADA